MKDLNLLKRKLDEMSVNELYEYVKENYPENEDIGIGSKKLIIRRILNLERNRINAEEA
ncbi:hypothetical protein SAMN02910340_01151 [Methanosarcina thermophila]|uniref:Uncharacterized protein n=3 Tax=Methanosarcina thermophila TaxID=2210 RepID=A0A1I6YZ74_METTE|nr:hypothetical protein [Methanosarcina thermophila]AKB12119.1 hypothetical protein MSTHT_0361 [Methanosarcina thermophila TM-1]AKB14679.1 hypothetical protein MSTHC_0361 [Methanosarcina thermophila CHTI-55]NLU57334.1 hypothetical protein [Methanosarcina thermophila]SFT55737.1 hypothetical protein SAMN02910340_01151 [Methanosarcina thermophila]BAW29764.1 conserved hypothetical protein [Methanosarcina thermophila]